MSTSVRKHSSSYWIKWFISFLIPLCLFIVPETELYSHNLKMFCVLTIFFICIVAFEFFDILIPSLLLPAAYVLFNVAPMNIAYSPWTTSVMWQTIGGFLIANILDETGLLKRCVYWFVIKCKGNFNRMMYSLMTIGILANFFTFGNAFVIIMTVCYGFYRALKFDKNSREAIIICLVTQMATIMSVPYIYSPYNLGLIQLGAATVIPDLGLYWYNMPLHGFPVLVISYIIATIYMIAFKTKNTVIAGGVEYLSDTLKKMGKMTTREKKTGVIFLIIIIYLFTTPLTGLDSLYGFILIPLLFFFPGIDVATSTSIRKLDFSLFAFFAACIGIGSVGATINIADLISFVITPIIGHLSPNLYLLSSWILGVICNVVMTPSAFLAIFPGPLAQIALDIGISNPLPVIHALHYANDMVFFPFENTGTLVLYGFGMVSLKQFFKYNVVKMLIFIPLFFILIIPWWHLIGLL